MGRLVPHRPGRADFISQIYLQPTKYLRDQLLKEERSGVVGWHVGGDVTTTLNELASAMHDAGLAGAWRAEPLAATDGKGAGYVVEHIDWYRCTVPEALVPCNQDGEVEQFALMDDAPLIAAMARGAFTLEAALILAAVMGLDQAGQVQPRFVLYRSTLRAG